MDGACVVLLPTTSIGDEHCTVIYFGDTTDATMPYEAAMRTTRTLAGVTLPFSSQVTQHSIFGPADDQVAVAELALTMPLIGLRTAYERFNGSEYREFKPHISAVEGRLRQVGESVRFNRLACWYGDEKACWLLGTNRQVAAV